MKYTTIGCKLSFPITSLAEPCGVMGPITPWPQYPLCSIKIYAQAKNKCAVKGKLAMNVVLTRG